MKVYLTTGKCLAFFLIFLGMIISNSPLFGNDADTATVLFNQGNEAYRAEDYDKAANLFREALTYSQSAALHYNLGKTFVRLDKIGPAVLHFEKALVLETGDADIRMNLNSLRQKEALPAPDYDWLTQYAMNMQLTVWIVTASVAFWLLTGLLIFPRFYGGHNIYTRLAMVLSIIALLASSAGLLGYHVKGAEAIVLLEDTPLRVAPTSDSHENARVHAGELVRIKKTHDNYYFVESLDQKTGWATREEVQKIWE